MDYIYLLIACLFFSLQFIFQKFFKRHTVDNMSVCLWNLVVLCIAASLYVIVSAGVVKGETFTVNPTALLWALLYSVSGVVCSVSTITAMGCGKVAVIGNACLAGGMVLPFIFGIIALDEQAGILHWLGIILMCVSMIPSIISKDENAENQNSGNLKFKICCVIIFMTNGLVSIFSKVHQISSSAVSENSFVLIANICQLVMAVVLILFFAAMRKKDGEKDVLKSALWEIGNEKMTGKMFILLLFLSAMYAVCNTLGNLFSLRCMVTMDASVQFPVLSAVVIVLVALLGRIFFKEKIDKITLFSLILDLCGIVLVMVG